MNIFIRSLPVFLVAVIAVSVTPSAQAAEKEIVGYRMQNWKTVHADGTQQAESQRAMLKKIGCEVRVESHGSHVDIMYRCPEWKRMALKSHQAAHQWENWLKAAGFETKHSH